MTKQLGRKRPDRKEELPETLVDFAPFRRFHVRLGPTLSTLARYAGTGVSGFRNGYLTALTEQFEDVLAGEAVNLMESFADRYINAQLPLLFYAIFSRVKLVALIKESAEHVGDVPDVRPLGIGECLRRATHSAAMADFTSLASTSCDWSTRWPEHYCLWMALAATAESSKGGG